MEVEARGAGGATAGGPGRRGPGWTWAWWAALSHSPAGQERMTKLELIEGYNIMFLIEMGRDVYA